MKEKATDANMDRSSCVHVFSLFLAICLGVQCLHLSLYVWYLFLENGQVVPASLSYHFAFWAAIKRNSTAQHSFSHLLMVDKKAIDFYNNILCMTTLLKFSFSEFFVEFLGSLIYIFIWMF